MNLGQLRREVRRILQEPTASLWDDSELNDYLNEAAAVMTADSMPLQAVTTLNSVVGQQEYELPGDMDEIFAVGYQVGNVFQDLLPCNPQVGTQDSRYTGTPSRFYVRAQTAQTMNRLSTGLMDIDPIDSQNGNRTSMVIGLNPAPSEADRQIVIQYYANHFRMTNDLDVPVIPLFAQRGLIAYAVAQAKYKEQAYAEIGQVYMPIFAEFSQKLKVKNMDRGIQMRGRHKAYIPGVTDQERTGHGSDVVHLPWTS